MELEQAEAWAHSAVLRSERSCSHAFCARFTVEEALLLCMFYLWRADYGPGWEEAVDG